MNSYTIQQQQLIIHQFHSRTQNIHIHGIGHTKSTTTTQLSIHSCIQTYYHHLKRNSTSKSK